MRPIALSLSCAALLGCGAPRDLPEGDRDQDRIPDAVDRCPDDAEDEDGFLDQDGCYDADDDGDRVPDSDDLCRCLAEDHDGFEDDDGCPDPDDDGDRIRDECDACPRQPEVYDGCADGDGCPDRPSHEGCDVPPPRPGCEDPVPQPPRDVCAEGLGVGAASAPGASLDRTHAALESATRRAGRARRSRCA